MKKTLTLATTLVLCLTCGVVLAACGGKACTHEGYIPTPATCLAIEIELTDYKYDGINCIDDYTVPADANRAMLIVNVEIVDSSLETVTNYIYLIPDEYDMDTILNDAMTSTGENYTVGGYGAIMQFVAIGKDGVFNWSSELFFVDQF